MNLSAPFIQRPVATTLLTMGIALAGIMAFRLLPVAPLPQIDFPAIVVSAQMPGASPEVMASSVATPLERHLGTIADVTDMTSTSSQNSTTVQLLFGLDRDIDGAARDVQAAIVAARQDLPTSLRTNPVYRKFNASQAPVIILSLTSDTLSQGQIYDAAATVVQQKLSQLEGVGNVQVQGSALPAVRVELNPTALFRYGIGLEGVRAALAAANANAPKGAIETDKLHFQIYTNDQASTAAQYKPLLIAYRNGSPVRLQDIAQVIDQQDGGVENIRNYGLYNGKPAISVIVSQQPGANIIETVDRVKAMIPELEKSIPSTITLQIAHDRSVTIRASLKQVERTLVGAVFLVILVVFVFLRDWRSTLIPAVAVPVSLIGTFGAMYLLGFSLDNFSLMALTIATGFVVDDAIVVMENTTRHIEAGMPRMKAAFVGAREVGFTVLSMSLSLVAVFLPLQLMGGLVGRLFYEFTTTLTIAILISLVVSLTTTPMMCARLLGRPAEQPKFFLFRWSERAFERMRRGYQRSLATALDHGLMMVVIIIATIVLNIHFFIVIPKGFFPQQDTGHMRGAMRADQSTSFQSLKEKMIQAAAIIQADPAVATVVANINGGGNGPGGPQGGASANFNITLKPLSERKASVDQVIARLRPKFFAVKGTQTFLQADQDIPTGGGRAGNAQYQYTLTGNDLNDLKLWSDKLRRALQDVPEVADVDTDQQVGGLEAEVIVDRDSASRLGLEQSQIDNALYDAFGQRLVSTIYNPLNQYHVVMEVAPQYWQSPDVLKDIYVSTSGGAVSGSASTNAVAGTTVVGKTSTPTATAVANDTARNAAANALANTARGGTSTGAAVSTAPETMVPLSAFAHFGHGSTPTSVAHQGTFAATTVSFNLPVGEALDVATEAIDRTTKRIGMPATIHGEYAGTAKNFRQYQGQMPLMLVGALLAVYIVLGILYESYIHPITILSTLPSAGLGALIALIMTGDQLTIIALIGILLLIGIVKKNAIMMVDFALDAERMEGLSPREAIIKACALRFRPIMMTTMAAIFGALPLALASGDGTEMRRPLGISIVGGLVVSQLLTLYTTPVVYLYMERFRQWRKRKTGRKSQIPLRPRPMEAGA
ncbi:MAG TPA: efflux RND transporter permease subunit [Alphaproteobacteria bacterium]|jgi:multidrug efflux pump|nr:efflux RND transporter permease subunit [Alphaproteobacteria bacterium]